jgi:hypothetical protein
MKKTALIKSFAWSLLALVFAVVSVARADTLVNTFNNPFDYVANGIIGDTNWDGVYLNHGDVPGGTGAGTTIVANETTIPGFLTVQGSVGNWAGATDSSFFLYKVVQGDFDVSVDVGAPFLNPNYHLPGVMARLYNPNNSGSPYSITTTNASENWIYNSRWEEFGGDIHGRFVTNNVDHDGYCSGQPSDSSDISTADRYLRITRVGDTFTLYEKTNQFDAWFLIANSVRTFPEWHGLPMQVGVHDESGTGNTPVTYFSDFELSGTNVSFPVMPAAPANLVTTATNTTGSLTFSWNVGTPGDSSLIVMKPGGNIQHNPINGINYTADRGFGDANTLLGGANEFVVYSGTNTSVTVTNLAGNNTTYTVALFEYSTNGSSIVYNTASPVTNSFPGPGVITGVITTIAPTNIPAGGATLGTLLATFSSGSATVDESAVATWTSSDPTIAYFTGRVLTALTNGTLSVTGSFGGFSASATIIVTTPAFKDNFATTQDYIASGVVGSTWDGLFLNYSDVPLTTAVDNRKGNDAVAGVTSRFIANTNVLTIEAAGSTWAVAGNDGPFLYKIVTGDFQVSVHVGPQSTINSCDSGIMARIYNNAGGALQGGGGGAGGTETHINWVKVQNGTPAVRRTIDSGGTTTVNGLNATDRWFLMQRVNSTNFLMFESSDPVNVGWSFVTSLVVAEAANNAPMEVGLLQEMRSAADGSVAMDSFMVDGPGITPPATPPAAATNATVTLNGDLSMTFNWVVPVVSGNAARSLLVMRAGAPVTALPTLSQAGSIGGTGTPVNFGTGLNVGGGNYVDFSTAGGLPASATNTTATVKGLTPGVTYYAVVVTYIGSGGSKSFNASGVTIVQQDGSLLSIQTLPLAAIPRGGVGQLQVMGLFSGGASVNVSAFAGLTSGNTNIVAIASGVLTGITNGTTTVQVIYGGFTNSVTVTVRDPGFTDSYGTSHDYLINGATNTPYDGVYNPNGLGPNPGVQVPESTYVPPSFSGATVADANTTSNGVLTLVSAGDGWENEASGGFFLYKYVPGDFQVAVHLNSFIISGFNMPGLLARAYTTGTNGTEVGSPFVLGQSTNSGGTTVINGESWVSLSRFDEYAIGTYARLNLDSAVLQSTQGGGQDGANTNNDGNLWLLIVRSSGTNFNFYMRAANTQAWKPLPLKTSYQVGEFAGVPMQVGIMAGPWNGGGQYNAQFDSYMLDYTTGSPLKIVNAGGGNVTVSWPAGPTAQLQSTTNLNSAVWLPVGGTPTLGTNGYSLTIPDTHNQFFRLVQ